jgi:hypothetical protein
MPLTPGASNSVVSGNIREMVAAGHPQRQAVAAAMREKDQSKAKGFAIGGAPMMPGGRGLGSGMMGDLDKTPFGGMFGGDSTSGKGGFKPSSGPTGGATAPGMSPLASHFAPPPAGAAPGSMIPQPSSSTYGTTTAGIMPPATRASGGAAPQMPWFARNEARSMLHTGPIHSPVPGRTDKINMRVPNGAYVLPADYVSHMGQSNTAAGQGKISRMFSSGPFGTSLPKMVHGRGAPPAPAAPRPPSMHMPKTIFASGGKTHEGAVHGDDDGVEIVAAGGEHVLSPDQVRVVGEGNIDHGHKILDLYVKKVRAEHIKTLKKLPGPAK